MKYVVYFVLAIFVASAERTRVVEEKHEKVFLNKTEAFRFYDSLYEKGKRFNFNAKIRNVKIDSIKTIKIR